MATYSQKVAYISTLVSACAFGSDFLLPTKIRVSSAAVKLTHNCNSRCVTCDLWQETSTNAITRERAIRLLDELHSLGIGSINFTGGETLLRTDFFDILRTRGSTDFHSVYLWSNGLLLDRFHSQINDSIITHVNVSIDGGPQNNDTIRGVNGYYEKAFLGLSKLHRKKITIQSTMNRFLSEDLEQLILLCKQRGYALGINLPDTRLPFFSSSRAGEAIRSLWPSEAETEKMLAILDRYGIFNRTMAENARSYLLHGELQIKRCVLGYLNTIILPSGDVKTGCYALPHVGNILREDLQNIIASNKYSRVAKRMFSLDCPRCTCGYSLSLMYQNPFKHIQRILGRLTRRGKE